MNYSEMSDFEINKCVATSLGVRGFECGNVGCGSALKFTNGAGLDYCNSWSDGGPIIQSDCISINFYQGNWMCSVNPSQETSYRSAFWIDKNNPLRAAMIVFLIMRDAGNA